MPLVRTAVVAALCVLATGCGGGDGPDAAPSPRPTSIAKLDISAMRVVRVAFCDLVPKKAVRAALSGAPVKSRSWRSGDPVREAGGDLGQEFGCAWYGPRSRVARAWVFARPVTPAFARTLIRTAGTQPGCRTGAGPGFGKPSVVQTCTLEGGRLRIRHAGLFGSTWLSCEVSSHGDRTVQRRHADAWCVSVASALNAG